MIEYCGALTGSWAAYATNIAARVTPVTQESPIQLPVPDDTRQTLSRVLESRRGASVDVDKDRLGSDQGTKRCASE